MKASLCFLVTSILVQIVGASGTPSLLSRYERESFLWPARVGTTVQLVGQKHGNTLKPGSEGVFLRLADGKCHVDFGHNGIFELDISETDFVSRRNQLKETRSFESQGLFEFRYTKLFFDPARYHAYQLGEWDSERYVVVYREYFPSVDSAGFLETLAEASRDEKFVAMSTRILLVIENDLTADGLIETYRNSGIDLATVAPFQRKGVIHTLSHDHENRGDVVLLDKNGRILWQAFAADFVEPELLVQKLFDLAEEHRQEISKL